jgi:3D (Asp-Asp-Asp) domain-containing protein
VQLRERAAIEVLHDEVRDADGGLARGVDRDVIPIGTRLYVEELDGARLPGLMLAFHDGCVVADDTGDRMTGKRVDWFVGREESYAALDARLHLTKITVHDGGERCAQPH